MAQKKNSKKHLARRVARLKTKIATLSSSLNKKQSELGNILSKVQKKLDKIRKQHIKGRKQTAKYRKETERFRKETSRYRKEAARVGKQRAKLEEFTSLNKRNARLVKTTEGLTARLRELEQTVSLLESTRAETRELAAGSVTETTAPAQFPEGSAEGLEQSFEHLAERTRVLEGQYTQLHTAQEGLELQIALLSREAEEGGAAFSASAPPEVAQAPAPTAPVAAGTEDLDRRTAELEAGQASLAEQDEKLAGRLQSLEERVSDLDSQVEQSGEPGIPPVLEEKIVSLSTDQSRDHTRIEEILTRSDDVEKVKLNFMRHTDVLSDRIAALDDEVKNLQALDSERRLDQLERGEAALQRSFHEDHERLETLDDTEQKLDQRLLSAIDDAAVLEERVRALGTSGEELGGEIDRLEVALGEANAHAREHQERLQAHEVRLEEQRQQIEEAAEIQRKATEGLDARLATLDESRLNLQEAADGLRVQQVRQDHDTQALSKSMQRRTLVGILLLLAAGLIGFLLPRSPETAAEIQTFMQAGEASDKEAAAAIAALQNDMGVLRREVVALSKTVADLSRTVEQIEVDATPDVAGQLGGLAEAVEGLEQRDLALEKENLALRTTQEEQQQEATELKKAQDAQREENAALRQEQEQLKEAFEKVSADVTKLAEQKVDKTAASAEAPATVASEPDAQAPVWTQAQKSRRYTVQLAGFRKQTSLNQFLKRHDLGSQSAVYDTTHQGQPWHVVFYGVYRTVDEAVTAIRKLPPELNTAGPWVRRIPKSGEIQPR